MTDAQLTDIDDHRPYENSAEQIAGAPPAADQKYTSAEFNRMRDTIDQHAPLINQTKQDLTDVAQRLETIEQDSGDIPKFDTLIGNDSDSYFVLVHGLGKEPESVDVLEVGTNDTEPVMVKVLFNSTQIKVGPFAGIPAVNAYRIIAE